MAEFQRGSVIVCAACQVPIYVLERGIGPTDKAGQATSAFRPVTKADVLMVLQERPDIDPGWQLYVREWLQSYASRYVFEADRPKAGQDAVCPNCGDTWVTVRDREYGTVGDKGYVLELWDIPPVPGASRTAGREKWRLAREAATRFPEPTVIKRKGVAV